MRAAIRGARVAMTRNRMMADVATADVVVVNPTHVAVALKYEPDRGAPRVVAKGAGTIAAKIRERGRAAPRADGRGHAAGPGAVRRCEIGQEVPADLFKAVATVLALHHDAEAAAARPPACTARLRVARRGPCARRRRPPMPA